jgi:hypothetical protein
MGIYRHIGSGKIKMRVSIGLMDAFGRCKFWPSLRMTYVFNLINK